MSERMSDERLAQLSFAVQLLSPFPPDHPATRTVVDEVKRARGEETRLRAVVADEVGAIGQHFERDEELAALRDLLGSIWLYTNWRAVTKQLTAEQRELWAFTIDAVVGPGMVSPDESPRPVADRWWRDDA